MTLATTFLQDRDFINALYIVAFVLFIVGLRGLAGPRTAPLGNRIAAIGMFKQRSPDPKPTQEAKQS